jgi:ferrochelatase
VKRNGKGVLLIGFGGPTGPDEVRPFLREVTRGRGIPSARIEEVAHHYELVGGRSPYNEVVARQAAALRRALARDGIAVPVYVGMRNWRPAVKDALAQMARDGVSRAIGFVLAPHRSPASWDSYLESVSAAQAMLGAPAPVIDYVERWHNHPLFIEAVAAQVRRAIAQLSLAQRHAVHLIFTAHSIPQAIAARAAYAAEFEESALMVAKVLGHESWSLAYQSRSGDPREPWLEPDVAQVIGSFTDRAAVVVPIGFVCENVELLYDLDIEAAGVARAHGVTMVRASAVNDDPRFIAMMVALIRERFAGGAPQASAP